MPTISITTDAANAQRLATAFGKYWALGRDATQAEIRAYLVRQLVAVVRNAERRDALTTYEAGSADPVTT